MAKRARETVHLIERHPLIPSSVCVRGFIIDSTTGKLTEVDCTEREGDIW